ncbi:MAG TPA: tRNA lysidine(34) synthetase TilS [Puia sp.]|jgi:tRNA(Ile)-lysidine synthase|nr:tRNA lysidine(34) synthetase TilS [Puia sp.]
MIMDLVQAFTNFIAEERLFTPGDRLLLAVSGGLDSAVLCELSHRVGLDFTIAHCNFGLRGAESDRDEGFVRQLGKRYGREVLVMRYDTERIAEERKLSIQAAAREMRYAWFRQVVEAWDRRGVIVTAHHLDDNIETMVMNFFRGTGLTGLRGMLPRQGDVARPLLFADRAVLQRFAEESKLTWVEDSSNLSDKYTRNFFRHQVLPLVERAYPAAMDNLADNLCRFREIEVIYRKAIEQVKKKLLVYRGDEVHIPVLKLRKSGPLSTLIYELFSPYGFTPQQAGVIEGLLDSPSGKYVCSATHRLLKDRRWLILTPLNSAEPPTILIGEDRTIVDYGPNRLQLEWLPDFAGQPSADTSVAWLDAKEISFPLLLRRWRPGDYFYPLGMRKKKKLARFLIDQRLSLAEKEKVWVLEMNKKIIWVVGRRIDDRFKLTDATRQILRITASDRSADGSAH